MPLNAAQRRVLEVWMRSKAIVTCPACGQEKWRLADAAYVRVHGDPDPLFGILEDWDARGGVVLRHTEDMARLTASRVEDVPSEPRMILVTWSAVRCVSVLLDELEKD